MASIAAKPPQGTAIVQFGYTNWKGKTGIRRAKVIGFRYGTSSWHKEPGWLLHGFDLDRGEEREFAVKDMVPIVGEVGGK